MIKNIESPLTTKMLGEKFSDLEKSPKDNGSVDLIVARSSVNKRKILSEVDVTIDEGLLGDRWNKGKSKNTERRKKTQITLMNSKVIEMIAGGKENWSMAGDQLFVNLDLSIQNLPAGQMIAFGSKSEVVLEITEPEHTGCSKFSSRYGKEALAFINAPERKELRLRGIYAKVIKPGKIKLHDKISKI